MNALTAATLAVFLAAGSAPTPARAHAPSGHRLLVLSVDGLDWRYLRDADRLGLRIPHMRRLLAEGDVANGVVDEEPTLTWPAHTTLITGVPPRQHGVLANGRPDQEGGEGYWDPSVIRVPTLWSAARAAGLTVGAVTWPVTVTRQIDFDLPEYFKKRHGGGMDLASIESKATPGLVDRITSRYPSFRQQWLNDRTRVLATRYITREAKADLTLAHLVDLDAESHEQGPFTPDALALVEYTDELIGTLMEGSPDDLVIALVSDHGFERTDRTLNLAAWMNARGLTPWSDRIRWWLRGYSAADGLEVRPGLVATRDAAIARALALEAAQPGSALGRQVPPAELARWAPELAGSLIAFEPGEHVAFVREPGNAELYPKPREPGTHHFWPGREGFRSVFLLWGPSIPSRREPEMSILGVCSKLAAVLGIRPPT